MGRGLGDHQRAVLAALADPEYFGKSVRTLAEETGRSMRQTRAAAVAMERRGLVLVTRNEHLGWTEGVGGWKYRYNRCPLKLGDDDDHSGCPDVLLKGEPLPPGLATYPGEKAWETLHLTRIGVPQHG